MADNISEVDGKNFAEKRNKEDSKLPLKKRSVAPEQILEDKGEIQPDKQDKSEEGENCQSVGSRGLTRELGGPYVAGVIRHTSSPHHSLAVLLTKPQ